MTTQRAVLAVVAAVIAAAAVDAFRTGGRDGAPQAARAGHRVDLATSRAGTWLPPARLRRAFPDPDPRSIAVSKVAVAPDETVAVAVSHVPGGERRPRAAIELWDGDALLRSFSVPVGSFSLGMWFADEGDAIATIGWDERARVYDRNGRRLSGEVYFAYRTG